jgi:hypothetical protein
MSSNSLCWARFWAGWLCACVACLFDGMLMQCFLVLRQPACLTGSGARWPRHLACSATVSVSQCITKAKKTCTSAVDLDAPIFRRVICFVPACSQLHATADCLSWHCQPFGFRKLQHGLCSCCTYVVQHIILIQHIFCLCQGSGLCCIIRPGGLAGMVYTCHDGCMVCSQR